MPLSRPEIIPILRHGCHLNQGDLGSAALWAGTTSTAVLVMPGRVATAFGSLMPELHSGAPPAECLSL